MGGRAERAPVHLGQAEGGVVGGHDHVGVAGQPDAAAQAEALHGGDDRHLAVVDGGEGGGAAAVDPDQRLVALGVDLLDVDPGAEAAPLGPQDHHPIVGHPTGGDERVGQGEPARHIQRVHRRMVDDHLADPAVLLDECTGMTPVPLSSFSCFRAVVLTPASETPANLGEPGRAGQHRARESVP